MSGLWQDLRLALRVLAKSRAYTVVAILTLGLAIGATSAIYSVVYGVLLRPLPYARAGELVAIWESHPSFPRMSVSYLDYQDWVAQQKSFSAIGCYRNSSVNWTGGERAERLRGLQFTASLMPALGIAPALGRNFRDDEDRPGGAPVVMIGDALWKQRFGGDPGVLGRTMTLNGVPHVIVGVLDPEFLFQPKAQVITPIGQQADQPFMKQRGNHPGISGMARLAPGVSLEKARADMKAIGHNISFAVGRPVADGVVPALAPLHEELTRDVRGTLWLLMGAVLFVLLVALANVASLSLARGATRRKEMAVRAALGAGRFRLIRQVLVESGLVSLAGGAVGMLLAMWAVDLLGGLRPDSIPTESVIRVDLGVLAFTVAISVAAGVLFGILPALQAARAVDLSDALKEGDARAGESAARQRSRGALVVAEVAMALVLLAGAGLSLKTFAALSRLDLGFRPDGVLVAEVLFPPERGKDPAAHRAFLDRLDERIRAIPGVASATISTGVPIFGSSESSFEVPGETRKPGEDRMAVSYTVDGAYLPTLGIPLLAGRNLADSDTIGQPPVAVVDEQLARHVFPGKDPIGQRVSMNQTSMEIVGVVRHVVHYGPGQPEPASMQMYVPWRQVPDRFFFQVTSDVNLTLRARPGIAPESLIPDLKAQVTALDGTLPVFGEATLVKGLGDSLAGRRFAMLLLAVFAAVAVVLAVVGLYSVVSYLVAQRTREIGVRMALGARPGDVQRLVVAHGLRLTAAGIVLGGLGAVALARVLGSLVTGAGGTDPLTLGAVAALLAVASAVASWLPARRASRVDPMIALRSE